MRSERHARCVKHTISITLLRNGKSCQTLKTHETGQLNHYTTIMEGFKHWHDHFAAIHWLTRRHSLPPGYCDHRCASVCDMPRGLPALMAVCCLWPCLHGWPVRVLRLGPWCKVALLHFVVIFQTVALLRCNVPLESFFLGKPLKTKKNTEQLLKYSDDIFLSFCPLALV